MNHIHPIAIWGYLSRFSFLLVLPLIQAIFREPFSIVVWSSLPALLSVTAISWFLYRATNATQNLNGLNYQSGLFIRQQKQIPYSSLASVSFRINPFYWLSGAAHLFLDTPGGNKRKPDLQFPVYKAPILAWWESVKKQVFCRYRAKSSRILLIAASWSNPGSGLLFVALILNRSGRILGEEIPWEVYDSVNQSYRLVALGMPPILALLSWLLILGWLAAFSRQFFRYAGFTAERSPKGILITRGLLIRNYQLLLPLSLRAVSLRQTLFMYFLRLHSAYLHTVGSGKEKGDRSLLLAAAAKGELTHWLPIFYPAAQQLFKNEIRPQKSSLFSFLWIPLLNGLAAALVFFALSYSGSILAPLSVFLPVFPVWQFFIRILAWRRSFFAVNDTCVVLSGYTGLQLYTAILPREKLQTAVLRQNPLQQLSGRCSLQIRIGSEKHSSFTVRHLSKAEVSVLLSALLASPIKNFDKL